jgi:hypothetical protein
MNRLLSGLVATVLIVSTSGASPGEDRAARPAEARAAAQERLEELKAKVRAQREAPGRLGRRRGPVLVVPPDPQDWAMPTPYPWVMPVPEGVPFPDPAWAGSAPATFDRCLVVVDPSAFDPRFATRRPEVDSRMVVAPKVRGLPAGSWPGRPLRR